MTPGASLDSDYSRELKVSSWKGPLETYYWLLSRWLDVFKELLHSNRIQSCWLYLLLSQENGGGVGKIACLFQGWLISLSLDGQESHVVWKSADRDWVLQQLLNKVIKVHSPFFLIRLRDVASKGKSTGVMKQKQQHGKSNHSFSTPTLEHKAALANSSWMNVALFG